MDRTLKHSVARLPTRRLSTQPDCGGAGAREPDFLKRRRSEPGGSSAKRINFRYSKRLSPVPIETRLPSQFFSLKPRNDFHPWRSTSVVVSGVFPTFFNGKFEPEGCYADIGFSFRNTSVPGALSS
jgi:hypothetical protein